ncbi:MAG: hypothetical protein HYV07_12050 [Deltaproteobacteria bacterium]|nr:hypothetical protein [Deltaproteobacteria bacterium]
MGLFDFFKKKTIAAEAPRASSKPAVRVADVAFLPVGADTWVISRASGKASRLVSSDAGILERCTRFRTTLDHAGALGEALGLDRNEVSELAARLDTWVELGFLVSSRAIPRGQAGTGVAISVIGVNGRGPELSAGGRTVLREASAAFLERIAEASGLALERVARVVGSGGRGAFNGALLRGAGSGVACFDQGLTGRAAALPESPGTTIADDPRGWWPKDGLEPAAIELCAPLEALLGKPLGAAVAEPIAIPEISTPMLSACTSERARIRAVVLGALGPSARSLHERLVAEGKSRTRLVDEGLRVNDAEHARGTASHAIGHAFTIAAPALAIDAREYVPPFLGEDASSYGWVFGQLVPRGLVAHVPLLAECTRPLFTRDPTDTSVERLLALAGSSFGALSPIDDPRDRTLELAEHLRALASSDELLGVVESARLESLSAWARRLDAALSTHEAEPKEWVSAVGDLRARFEDAAPRRPSDESLGVLRKSLGDAAETLEDWPRLFEAALKTRESR